MPRKHRRLAPALQFVANGSKAVSAAFEGEVASPSLRPDAGDAGSSQSPVTCAKWGSPSPDGPQLRSISVHHRPDSMRRPGLYCSLLEMQWRSGTIVRCEMGYAVFSTTIPRNVLPESSLRRQTWLNEEAGGDIARALPPFRQSIRKPADASRRCHAWRSPPCRYARAPPLA
jgi:hypothetical protein